MGNYHVSSGIIVGHISEGYFCVCIFRSGKVECLGLHLELFFWAQMYRLLQSGLVSASYTIKKVNY